MPICLVTKPRVFQLRALRLAVACCRARSWRLFGPQLENEVLLLVKIQNEADDRGLYLTNVWLECQEMNLLHQRVRLAYAFLPFQMLVTFLGIIITFSKDTTRNRTLPVIQHGSNDSVSNCGKIVLIISV